MISLFVSLLMHKDTQIKPPGGGGWINGKPLNVCPPCCLLVPTLKTLSTHYPFDTDLTICAWVCVAGIKWFWPVEWKKKGQWSEVKHARPGSDGESAALLTEHRSTRNIPRIFPHSIDYAALFLLPTRQHTYQHTQHTYCRRVLFTSFHFINQQNTDFAQGCLFAYNCTNMKLGRE